LVWLDALASGLCPPNAFLRAMQEQFQGDREGHWEVLSLLDQYYRLGKINAEVFQTVKSQLQDSALGTPDAAAARAAAPKRRPATPAPVAIPVPVAVPIPVAVTAPVADAQEPSPGAVPPVLGPAVIRAPAAGASAAAPEVAEGDVLRNRYTIRRVLGRGGMGTVFEAMDDYRLDRPANGQRIAIKVLHAAIAKREELLAELQLEFQHLQSLSHPNIVRVHDVDRDGDIAFFTMELLTGALLNHVLTARATALPRPYALAIIRDAGAALSYAHAQGVIHGAVNPQNIFITNDGELRVLAFGASSKRAPVARAGYASCQVLEGQHPDSRDDLFAFACVVYLLLSGQHPFPTHTSIQARAQRLAASRPPGLTTKQWRVLREGLRWERDERPADIKKWLDRFGLDAAAARVPPLPALLKAPAQQRPKSLLTAAVLIVFALLAVGGYWAVTDPDSTSHRLTAWLAQARSAFSSDRAASPPPAAATAPISEEAPPTAAAPPAARDIASAPATNQAPPAAPPLSAAAPVAEAPSASHPVPRIPAPPTPAATGSIRIEMAADTVEVPIGEHFASVIVHRRGSPRGEAIFKWWTESGTAKPGKEFSPVVPHVEQIADGSYNLTLSIPVSDLPRTLEKSFYVVIDQAESGPALGARNLTMVTLQPSD